MDLEMQLDNFGVPFLAAVLPDGTHVVVSPLEVIVHKSDDDTPLFVHTVI